MKKIKLIIHLGIGTLILSLIGLYNGYPLVYSDTGVYIASGLKEFVPVDRPIGYGLFIKLFSFNYSLWLVVAFQNLITAFVLYELLKTFDLSKKYFTCLYYRAILCQTGVVLLNYILAMRSH